MKKQILLFGIAFLISLFVIFSGCNELTNSEGDKFVGTWKSDNVYAPLGSTITFFSDGTANVFTFGGNYEIIKMVNL